MKPQLLYMIGASGAGKSTLMYEVMGDGEPEMDGRVNITSYPSGIIQLGWVRENFSGTDILPLDIHRYAEALVASGKYPRIIAEGDRLAYDAFFRRAQEAGYTVTVVFLDTPEGETIARSKARGKAPPAAFVKGRRTKAQRIAAKWAGPQWTLDGCNDVRENAKRLREHILFTETASKDKTNV